MLFRMQFCSSTLTLMRLKQWISGYPSTGRNYTWDKKNCDERCKRQTIYSDGPLLFCAHIQHMTKIQFLTQNKRKALNCGIY